MQAALKSPYDAMPSTQCSGAHGRPGERARPPGNHHASVNYQRADRAACAARSATARNALDGMHASTSQTCRQGRREPEARARLRTAESGNVGDDGRACAIQPTTSAARRVGAARRASPPPVADERDRARNGQRRRSADRTIESSSQCTEAPPALRAPRPMASTLTDRLSRLVKTMRGQARITEANVQGHAARGAHGAARGRRRAAGGARLHRAGQGPGARPPRSSGSLSPGQALVGIVHRELADDGRGRRRPRPGH